MSRTIYALLVGIDDYPNVRPLKGCVNDVERIAIFLKNRVNSAKDVFKPLILKNGEATRQDVVEAFRTHLGQAGSEDVALFYYSGHGSQAPTPQALWHLEPDHLDETLVCYDSRLPGSWDLADKELSQLIAEVAENNPHILVILDCCHSGSGTRALDPLDDVDYRRIESDQRQRPIDSYLFASNQAGDPLDPRSITAGGEAITVPSGRHLLISACRPDELAKELVLGGERRGALSYYLLDTLTRASSRLTYQDLFKRVDTLVRARVSLQSPGLEAQVTEDVWQPFLGGSIAPSPPYVVMSHDALRGWIIDAGEVHGVTPPVGEETTIYTLFPFDADLVNLEELDEGLGQAVVTATGPTTCEVEISPRAGISLDPQMTYKAVVTSLPLPPLPVALSGDPAALELIRNAMQTAGPDQTHSLLVREEADGAVLHVETTDNCYRIRRIGDAYKLVVDTLDYSVSSARLVVERLEHMARWLKLLEINNSQSALPLDAVQLEIIPVDKDGNSLPPSIGSSQQFFYYYSDGKWRKPGFKIKLTNTTDRELHIMFFYLPETYGVFPLLVGSGGGEILGPGQELWANKGRPYYPEIKDEYWKQGMTEFRDVLKLIVSTAPGDARALSQNDLPVSFTRSVTKELRATSPMSTLKRLMRRIKTRHIGSSPEYEEPFADWTAQEVTIITTRPLESVWLSADQEVSLSRSSVRLAPHSKLKARARLDARELATRDAADIALPLLIQDQPGLSEPIELTTSRGGGPGLSVLVLEEVEGAELVTAEDPLLVYLPETLDPGEMVLPLARDDEFFYPLGSAQATAQGLEVRLERLPPPTYQGTRDLKGSIKILFQKIIGQRLGLEFPYPILAVAEVMPDGEVAYDASLDTVRQKVAAASRLLLYMHGIIGDTRLMASSARLPRIDDEEIAALGDRYDLILTFDYESINTTIEDTARALGTRLAGVGLGPNHDKVLNFVVHSMGSLVSRWFIEREGGHEVVQQLIMLGPPNSGSPWPTVQAWTTTALAIGLNSLSTVAWPVKALSWLVKGIELVDVALDQIEANSHFLKTLNNSPDPHVPYTVIVGNTSVIPVALKPETGKESSPLERLLSGLKLTNVLHSAASLAFFNQPNDIAVSVNSAFGVPMNRNPSPRLVEVACDHVSYFANQASLQCLADLDQPNG